MNNRQTDIDQARNELDAIQTEVKKGEETLSLIKEEIDRKQDYVIKLQADAEREAKEIIASAHEEAEMIRKSISQTVTSEDCNERECDTCEKDRNAITKADVEDRVRIMENEIKAFLNNYRDSVQSMLNSFRTGLYSIEYTQVCDAYQRLYLFVTNSLEKRIRRIKENDSLDFNTKELVEKEIREIQGLLLKRVGGVERGMECMGLTMIRPSVGDKYNCNEHVADNAEDDGDMSADIKLCSCPGVKSDNRVLCKANVVVVEKEG